MPTRPGAAQRRGAMDRGLPAQLATTPGPLRNLRRGTRGMTAEIRYERIIQAPPETVFDAFTSEGGQHAFYGQDHSGWIVQSESELRVGGAWTIRFGPSPQQLYQHHHLFITIDRPRRLQLSTTETRLDGTTLRYETELTFHAVEGGTLMTM